MPKRHAFRCGRLHWSSNVDRSGLCVGKTKRVVSGQLWTNGLHSMLDNCGDRSTEVRRVCPFNFVDLLACLTQLIFVIALLSLGSLHRFKERTRGPKTTIGSIFETPEQVFIKLILNRVCILCQSAHIKDITEVDRGEPWIGKAVTHDVDVKRLGEDLLEVTPRQDLEPGEYIMVLGGVRMLPSASAGAEGTTGYDFGIGRTDIVRK